MLVCWYVLERECVCAWVWVREQRESVIYRKNEGRGEGALVYEEEVCRSEKERGIEREGERERDKEREG